LDDPGAAHLDNGSWQPMWQKQAIKVSELTTPNYNPSHEQCIVAGGLIFVAGQTGLKNGAIAATFVDQVRQAFANVEVALTAAGATLGDILSMNVFLTDVRNQPEFSKVRRVVLRDGLFASATVAIKQLFDPRALIEIQVVAVNRSFSVEKK
jgi:2-iminobutanoate/2-iminopropanoate deaminase